MKPRRFRTWHGMSRAEYREYLASDAWKAKRCLAFDTHGKLCAKCGSTESLHVHHKTYERAGGDERASDLQVLCEDCHVALHEKRRKRSKPAKGLRYKNKSRKT